MNEKEKSLRPNLFDEYIGQQHLIKQLQTHVKAEVIRKEKGIDSTLDHMVFEGPAGLGKTSISFVIANEINADIKIMQGTSIDKLGDLVANLIQLEDGDIFFLDEIHALKPCVEEALYSVMEDFRLDITTTEGKVHNITLPKFTLIGATTEMGKLKQPLQDRFVHKFTLQKYKISELVQIIERSAKLLNCSVTPDAAEKMARSARGTPRIANNLLKKARNYAEVYNDTVVNIDMVKDSFSDAGITKNGFNQTDIKYISALYSNTKPLGLKTLAGMIATDLNTIENTVEPFLLENGLIEKQSRGRTLTPKGRSAVESLGIVE